MKHLLRALSWDGTALILLDQTKLPSEMVHIRCENYRQVAEAIKILAVRGAPAIGVAAAYAVVLAFREARKTIDDPCALEAAFYESCRCIEQARPTAVNLSWAVREMGKVCADSAAEREEKLLCRAKEIEASDIDTCRRIGENGAALFMGKDRLRILTHCNTGALATAGIGTAFGVILKLFQNDQVECVYADETRPLLQGARLTASELMEDGIPCCLISDNMAAAVMRDKRIDAVIVGADRIAANGDTANKIGTYSLAVLAAYHHIPFYIAAPFSTFDFSIHTGEEIVIEERAPDEVRKIRDIYTAPKNVPVYNPAFDVVPSDLISGIITEKGVLCPPYEQSIQKYERSLSHESVTD